MAYCQSQLPSSKTCIRMNEMYNLQIRPKNHPYDVVLMLVIQLYSMKLIYKKPYSVVLHISYDLHFLWHWEVLCCQSWIKLSPCELGCCQISESHFHLSYIVSRLVSILVDEYLYVLGNRVFFAYEWTKSTISYWSPNL